MDIEYMSISLADFVLLVLERGQAWVTVLSSLS